jgi:hypothetical protein
VSAGRLRASRSAGEPVRAARDPLGMGLHDGTVKADEEHTMGPGLAETLWVCRTPECKWSGTSDEAIDHAADTAAAPPQHVGFDRVGG